MTLDDILGTYELDIAHNAETHELPYALVAAVIQVESGGDPWAVRYEPAFQRLVQREDFTVPAGVSRQTELNARAMSWGLMQIMGQVARERGCKFQFLSRLCNPADGIHWGCRQLALCRDRFLEQYGWAAVTAAYNGGFGAVKQDGTFTNPHYPRAVLAALGGAWPKE